MDAFFHRAWTPGGNSFREEAMNPLQEQPANIRIIRAAREDLAEILELQYLAYQSEALIHNDFSIQPLTQTLEETRKEYDNGVVLKAVVADKIVGSVRACAKGDTVFVGKLMVHPAHQNRGLGRRLLGAIEKEFPRGRFQLFTSGKSEKNLFLYAKCGYTRFKETKTDSGMIFVHLEKNPSLDGRERGLDA
jgi:GNAT superfamily N-acetyltransferase